MERGATQGYDGRVSFAVGTGRCGTEFLSRVVAAEPGVASSHERGRENEAFHRYCQWHELPVDPAGFLHQKQAEIDADLAGHRFSFEASAHLSLSILELHERFGARFALLVRRPERVVNSYLAKGWYTEPFVRSDPSLALGYQPSAYFHHFLGRLVPRGEAFEAWSRTSRVGKLGWYWSALNERVLRQLEALPSDAWRVQRLETLDHDGYRELAAFLGFETAISRRRFEALRSSRPNALADVPSAADWSAGERREFEAAVAGTAERLGYALPDYDVGAPSMHSDNRDARPWQRLQRALLRRFVPSRRRA